MKKVCYNTFMKKVVLITGASNGIGAQMARVFAKAGYHVVINYNKSQQNAEQLVKELSNNGFPAICLQADVSNLTDVNKMINSILKTFGHIDVLINNAGISSNNILLDETEENINNVISTNVLGTINCTKAVYSHMVGNNKGNIINMSSIWGVNGASGESVYSASKGAIIAFTKAMAKELAYSGVNVNCIAPGVVDTNMMKIYSQEELQAIQEQIPFGRFATCNEVAKLALYLASEDASYITGQVIQIDGGFNN